MAKYRHYTLYFSPDIDADVIEILDKSGNKSALIRKAIRKHLGVEQTPNTNPDISHWIRIRKNKTHFEYKCFNGERQPARVQIYRTSETLPEDYFISHSILGVSA